MKVLQVHNAYRQRGGEDQVVVVERDLLEAHGHEVRIFGADNDEIGGPWSRMKVAWSAPYSHSVRLRLAGVLEGWRPEVVHVHNFFPLLTPAILDACQVAGVPVVMTLHNFRLVCPGAFLRREGMVCEDCLDGTAYWAVVHRCYRGSIFGSLAVARMVEYHRRRRTWKEKVDRFIVMTEFARQKFAAAGWEAGRIMVKPHFCKSPGVPPAPTDRRGAFFAGRLSPEKGVVTLLRAWTGLNYPLTLAGEGPLRREVELCGNPGVRLLGWLSAQDVSEQLRQAAFLVVPSEWYETFGLVIIEAFAQGLPVIATRLGAMSELIEEGITGLFFEVGNPQDLERKVKWLLKNPEACRRMGENARRVYEEKYTPERNYQLMMNIYWEAIDEKKKSHRRRH